MSGEYADNLSGSSVIVVGWEGVKDPADRRKVVYWRYSSDGKRHVGAISRRSDEWRALGYTLNPAERIPDGNTELGLWPTRKQAEKAVLMYELLGRRAPQCPVCGDLCNWADDMWSCTGCGDEWDSDHGPEFADTDPIVSPTPPLPT